MDSSETRERLSRAVAALGLTLSAEELAKLEEFAALLGDRATRLGFVSAGDRDRIVERHVIDCLRAVRALEPGDRTAYDLGSGAGLPGVVIAVAARDLAVTLVESQRRRVAWLEMILERLALRNAVVREGRIEDLEDVVDVCFARALAPVDRVWSACQGLLRKGGRLVYFAGEGLEGASLRELPENYRILNDPPLVSGGPVVIIPGA